jgi:two-component system chemotaxis response regulator CheY
MFTHSETQLIGKTLLTRRDWLIKNLETPELATSKVQNQEILALIDSILGKIDSVSKNDLVQKPAQAPTNIISTPKAAKPTAAQKHSQIPVEKIRVLVVDDDSMIASLLQTILSSTGITKIDIAEDGLKAISMLYATNPVYDLVLCDWNMPIKNGLDVHNAMRAAERYIDTCFILVTAVTEAAQIRAAIEEGVDDYIVKPIEEQKILKKIARHFPQINLTEL